MGTRHLRLLLLVLLASMLMLHNAVSANATASTINPRLSFSYIPVYATAQPGQTILSQIAMRNTGSAAEYVNISTGNYTGILYLSSNNVTLQPGQSASISLSLRASQSMPPGSYYIPIYVNATSGGITTRQIKYITFALQSSTLGKPVISSQITLINNTNSASGIIEVTSPSTGTGNFTFKTVIVTPLAQDNLSSISAYGIDNNVTVENNSYVITWYVSQMPAGKSIYAYYTISNVSGVQALSQVDEQFIAPTTPKPASTLKLLNVGVPTFYANSVNLVNIYLQYTGTAAQLMNLSLNTFSNATVLNGTQSFMVQPGQYIDKIVAIRPGGDTGAILINLSVKTKGGSISYSLPVAVLQSITAIAPSKAGNHYYYTDLVALGIITAAMLLAVNEARQYRRERRARSKKVEMKVGNISQGRYVGTDSNPPSRSEIEKLIKEAKESGKLVNLSGKRMRCMDLNGLDLSGADLWRSDLTDANLIGTNLSNADIRTADLTRADLKRANLRNAHLKGAILVDADLRDADTWGAEMRGAHTKGTKL